MRKFGKTMALILTVAMVLSTFGFTAVFAADFSDTAGHWAETEISKWSGAGVINGYEDGSFDPDAYISRAELAQVIATAMEYTTEADISFTDVNGDEWFVDALKKCVAQGVIGGYEDGTFRPDDAVTREEAATMFQRAYKINSVGLLSFTDTDSISEWAKTSVTALVGAGVINGYEDGTFDPEGYITRAEVVKILDGITDAAVADDSSMSGANTNASTGSNSSIGSLGNRGSVTSSGSSSSGSSSSSTTYNVTFNANGGTIGTSATSKVVAITKNTTIGSKAPEATRDGYVFDGWYTTAAAADALNSTYLVDLDSKTVTSNTTLYAGWYEDADMTVTFETNGGSPVPESQTVKSGSTASKPDTDPTRTNYTFAGWYSDNAAKYEFDFDEDIIKADTTIYAGWEVDSAYAASEITIPTTTTGTLRTGTVEANPYSALPGESVTLKITPPTATSGQYGIETTPYISYTSTSGETVTLALSEGEYTFTEYGYYTYEISSLPSDIASDLQVVVAFKSVPVPSATATAEPTATPTATPDPTATPTIDPYAPTATPNLTTSYVFSEGVFADLDSVSANTETGGLTVSKDSTIDSSSKTFSATDDYPDNSGYSYSRRLKIGTATLSFKVSGPCTIIIDAASASSEDRSYSFKNGSEVLSTFTCYNGENNSLIYYYDGSATTLSIVPDKGINVYGIHVTLDSAEYLDTDPTATPAAATATPSSSNPTATPSSSGSTTYSDWLVGQVSDSGTDGSISVAEYQGKTALCIAARNAYKKLDSAVSSGKVTFSMDAYIPDTSSNLFRVYFENSKESNYQDGSNANSGVIAEAVNVAAGDVIVGPSLNPSTPVAGSYTTSGWYNFSFTLDYDKVGTSEFITINVTDPNGSSVVNGYTIGSISGIDTALSQIRIVGRASNQYFANMSVTTGDGTATATPEPAATATPDSSGGDEETASILWDFGASPFTVTESDSTHPDTTYFPAGSTDGRYYIMTTSITADVFNGLSFTTSKDLDNAYQSSKKTFTDGFSGTWQIKSSDASDGSDRYFSFTPSYDGTVTVYARSGSGSKDATVHITQDGTSLASLTLLADNKDAVDDAYPILTASVSAGTAVKIYGETNTSFFGIKYSYSEDSSGGDNTEPTATPEAEATATPDSSGGDSGDDSGDGITAETAWTFSTSTLADYVKTVTVDGSDKVYLTGNVTVNGLDIYSEAPTLNDEGTKVSSKSIEIDDSSKTVDGVDYPGRLKLGGTGTDNGTSSVRLVSFTPGVAGTVTIAAAHGSSSGDARTLAVMQGDTNIDGGYELAAGETGSKTFTVEAGTLVRIYSLSSGINLYGITFTPSAE